MSDRFTLRSRYFGGYLLAIVYDDLAAMRRAAERYNYGDLSQALGCWTPAPWRYRFNEDGSEVDTTYRPFAGVLRLARDHITTEIVAHELVHAAATLYRRKISRSVGLGDECGESEEALAYIVGDLLAQVSTVLADRDLWSASCG